MIQLAKPQRDEAPVRTIRVAVALKDTGSPGEPPQDSWVECSIVYAEARAAGYPINPDGGLRYVVDGIAWPSGNIPARFCKTVGDWAREQFAREGVAPSRCPDEVVSQILADLAAERRSRQADAEARKRKHIAEAEQAAKQAKAWINQHGSQHAKTIVRKGLDYRAIYQRERMALERPGWAPLASLGNHQLKPVREISEQALRFFEAAEAIAPQAQIRQIVCRHGKRFAAVAYHLGQRIVSIGPPVDVAADDDQPIELASVTAEEASLLRAFRELPPEARRATVERFVQQALGGVAR